MATLTRRSLLKAGVAAGAMAAGGLALPGSAQAARSKNLVVVGQNGNLNIVTPAGAMIRYYHNNWWTGAVSWLGPHARGTGFNSFDLIASQGVNDSYDNLYIGVNGSGVYGYYWDNRNDNFINGGAGVFIAGLNTTGWTNVKFVFSGGYAKNGELGCVFYTIDTSGYIYWHKYIGRPGAGGRWAIYSGRRIGEGFNNFRYVTANIYGDVYAVNAAGTIYYYSYGNPETGSGIAWPVDTGIAIGQGWYGGTYGYQTVQSGGMQLASGAGKGSMYMVDRDGNLRWNRFLGFTAAGQPNWQYPTGGGAVIGNGWM